MGKKSRKGSPDKKKFQMVFYTNQVLYLTYLRKFLPTMDKGWWKSYFNYFREKKIHASKKMTSLRPPSHKK